MKFANRVWLLNIILIVLFTSSLSAQNSITGRVFDATTKDPLIGASVVIEGAAGGTVTDFDGAFALRSDKPLPITLIVSYIGYESKQVRLDEQTKDLEILL